MDIVQRWEGDQSRCSQEDKGKQARRRGTQKVATWIDWSTGWGEVQTEASREAVSSLGAAMPEPWGGHCLPGSFQARCPQGQNRTRTLSVPAPRLQSQQNSSAASSQTHPRVGLLCADPGVASVACPVSERVGFRAPCTWPQRSLRVRLVNRRGVSQCFLGRAWLGPGWVSAGRPHGRCRSV